MSAFAPVVTLIWALFHGYAAQRLIGPLRLGRVLRVLCYLGFLALVPLSPAAFFRWVDAWLAPGQLREVLRWAGWLYMGWFSVLMGFLVVRDALAAGLFLARRAGASALPDAPERRRFLMTASGLGAAGVASGLGVEGVRQALAGAEVVEVDVPIPGLPEALEGYHIVQLSDVHVGHTIDQRFLVPVVERVAELSPDLIAVTGDIVDGGVKVLRRDVAALSYLSAPDGVFGVTGNHEYYAGAIEWCAELERLGIRMLNNAHQLVEREGARLLVAGVTDYRAGRSVEGHASDPEQALRDAPAHEVKILLAHQPRSAYAAAPLGFDLQLSGHTHGGQFFPWSLVVGLVQPVARGLAKLDGMWVYVNRGTCYWGPPMRTGVPAEITSLRLRRA